MSRSIHIREITWEEGKDALMSIRQSVFICEQRIPASIELDGKDPHCIHVLATLDNGQPIGCGRLSKSGRIGRLAVILPYRRHGIGSRILSELIHIATQQSFPHIYLHAQMQIQKFYLNHEFVAKGPVFMEGGLPHQTMQYQLAS